MEMEAVEDIRIASGEIFDINTRKASINAMESLQLHSGEEIVGVADRGACAVRAPAATSQNISTYAVDSIESFAAARSGSRHRR